MRLLSIHPGLKALLLAVLVCVLPAVASAESPRVAVLELSGKLSNDELSLLSDRVRNGVLPAAKQRNMNVLSRETMVAFLESEGLSAECLEGECEWKQAQMMGAAYAVSGSVSAVSGRLACTLKIHETTQGRLLATDSIMKDDVEQLMNGIPKLASALMAQALEDAAAKAPVQSGGGDIAAMAALAQQALAAQHQKLAAAATALKAKAAQEYTSIQPLMQMGVNEQTRPVLEAFIRKYSNAKVRVGDLEEAVVVPELDAVQSALGVGPSTGHRVAAGGYFSCGVSPSGALKCWGSNNYKKATPPSGVFRSVSLGYEYGCGVHESGTVKCWGDDKYGQTAPPVGRFSMISAGYSHACGVQENGAVKCWGNDSSGQGTPPPGRFTMVSAGTNHSCGVDESGAVKCWGSLSGDQPDGVFSTVGAGEAYSCGVTRQGLLKCWGAGNTATPPTGVFRSVSLGSNHACAIHATGSVKCWGKSESGSTNSRAGDFMSVSVGRAHNCAAHENGRVACWGNDYGGCAKVPSGMTVATD